MNGFNKSARRQAQAQAARRLYQPGLYQPWLVLVRVQALRRLYQPCLSAVSSLRRLYPPGLYQLSGCLASYNSSKSMRRRLMVSCKNSRSERSEPIKYLTQCFPKFQTAVTWPGPRAFDRTSSHVSHIGQRSARSVLKVSNRLPRF